MLIRIQLGKKVERKELEELLDVLATIKPKSLL